MTERVRAHDWATTPLGARANWPAEFCSLVDLMLASLQIASLVVGPKRVLLYNDAAATLYGDRHSRALGRPLPETWPEAWAEAGHYYDQVFAGESVQVPAQPLDLKRPGAGQVFEAYLTPVRDADGAVIAAHMTGFEVGARLRAEAALRASEAKLAEELAVTRVLQRISNSLVEGNGAEALYEQILHGARALMRSDLASLQMFDPERNELVLLAHHAFAPESASHWQRVSLRHPTSCGVAMAQGEMAIITDAEKSADLAGTDDLAEFRRSGIRSMQSTPLVSRGTALLA